MAVLIVDPDDRYATWLANALSGLTDRVVRAAAPDEAMAAVAAEGRDVLAAIFGPSLGDGDALALAGALQQGTPDISVVLIRQRTRPLWALTICICVGSATTAMSARSPCLTSCCTPRSARTRPRAATSPASASARPRASALAVSARSSSSPDT